MEFTGKLIDVTKDWLTGKMKLTFAVNESGCEVELEKLYGIEKLRVKAVQYREKRSLDANAYYWQLLNKVANKMTVSNAYVHNLMLRKYGQRLDVDGELVYLVIPDTEEAAKMTDEAETYHVKPTSQVKEGIDGKMYRTYIMLRGSSDYDAKEMSCLIEGLVQEAKELGIETIPEEEFTKMMMQYEVKK